MTGPDPLRAGLYAFMQAHGTHYSMRDLADVLLTVAAEAQYASGRESAHFVEAARKAYEAAHVEAHRFDDVERALRRGPDSEEQAP